MRARALGSGKQSPLGARFFFFFMKGKLTAAGWSDEFRDELLLGV
ncbi:transposase IS4 family protein [Glaesserella parasuis 12939]|nr:transposase IS4 family protein [Glaesserella parasuis 12939]